MKKYKVIALSVSGLKNKIFKLHDEVKENNFVGGRADQLVEQGFLKLIGEDEEVVKFESAEGGVEINQNEPPKSDEDLLKGDEDLKKEDHPDSEKKEEDLLKGDEDLKKEDHPDSDKKDESAAGAGDELTEDDVTKQELMADLEVMGIPFKKDMNKSVLYELWRSAKK